MGYFTHTPDNQIFVDGSVFPLTFFLTQEPAYTLQALAISQEYIQTVKHTSSDGSTATGYALPFADGDTYISKKAIYDAAYAIYILPSSPSLSEAKENRILEMLGYSASTKAGSVIVTNTYFSRSQDLAYLMGEDAKYTRAGSVPGGYYINDINYVQRSIANVAGIEAIIDRIVELHYLCRLNEDVHRAAINALGSVAAVEAYDYTTGWPTTPY